MAAGNRAVAGAKLEGTLEASPSQSRRTRRRFSKGWEHVADDPNPVRFVVLPPTGTRPAAEFGDLLEQLGGLTSAVAARQFAVEQLGWDVKQFGWDVAVRLARGMPTIAADIVDHLPDCNEPISTT